MRRRNVRRKVLVLLAAAFVGLSGVAACGQAVEDEVRQRVEDKVEQEANSGQRKSSKKANSGRGKSSKRGSNG